MKGAMGVTYTVHLCSNAFTIGPNQTPGNFPSAAPERCDGAQQTFDQELAHLQQPMNAP